jgi:hypothetical protein
VNRRNHPNHATLSHVQIIKRDRKKMGQRRFIPNDHENVEDENVEAEKEGQEEGFPEGPDVEMENTKM